VKIVFFNRFFFPDTSATSQILSDLAFHLAGEGANVHVVTSKVPGGSEPLATIRGVTVHRVTRAIEGPHGLARRALAYLGYYRGARAKARELLDRGDIAVLKTDPPLLSSFVGPIAHARGAQVIAWMHDVFPEVAREYGVPGMKGPLFALLRRMRNASLAAADKVVAIGEGMASRLAAEGVAPAKLTVIHNWADASAIRPVPRDTNALRRAWGLDGRFVVGYSGNLGRVHEFDTLLDAAKKLAHRDDIRFVIVGRGPRLAEVQARVERESIANVAFHPHQERASLGESLGVPDVHVCVLDPRFDSLVLPSKLYGIMAAARPILFVGDPRGESARIVADADCGQSFRTGDSDALAGAIAGLAGDPNRCEALGRAGRAAFETRYAMEKALGTWRETLAASGYKGS
jgi:glycosyltransferase involved in cell wall biosynthesis